MAQSAVSPDALYELGQLYREKCDFGIAIEKLQTAADLYFDSKNFEGYLNCLNRLLRIYAEMEDQARIDITKEKLQDLVLKQGIELSAKTYYTLGLCASHKGQHKTSLEFLEKSLALALASDDKKDIGYAINGLAIVYTALGRLDDALKEIYNMQVFFEVLDFPELRLSSRLMNGHILRLMGKHEQALDIFWQCYDDLKIEKNLYMYIKLLYAMGMTYQDSGEQDLARMYLGLAKRTVDPDNLKELSKSIDERLDQLGEKQEGKYDLVFNAATGALLEKKKGKVDFKNQFILLDMLRLFLKNPGEVYSKESLVKRVWKQNYDPGVHDNKIYVTIKRLRKMIEPDYDKPKYIFRAKNGYYLNRDTRVLLDQ